MAEFLTADWLADLDATAATANVPPDLCLVVQHVVTDPDGEDIAYSMAIRDGRVSVRPGRAQDPDVTFTQDRSTAAAIARGDLGAQVAFLSGRLRVGGDLRTAMEATRGVLDLPDLFAPARANTTW